jgi:uncharacterized repeat protein (TIGR03803 family)
MNSKTLALLSGITLLAFLSVPIRPATQEGTPTYSVLYSFTGGADGGGPGAPLVRDAVGNLYGTTALGGDASDSCPNGSCGVVFKLDPLGNETVLYTFTGGADGAIPGSLIRDTAGNLYGAAGGGGNTSTSCPFGSRGCGVVFKLDPLGNETVLYTFTGGADGAIPGSLIQDRAGNLYGTTYYGGVTSSSCPLYGSCGVVFKLDSAGRRYKVLYTFTGGVDGANPNAGLIPGKDGNLYGTTLLGGNTSSSCSQPGGCGVVFKLEPTGGGYSVLYTFTGGADGANPEAGLIQDPAGDLYGTTSVGGNPSGSCFFDNGTCGVVFKLDPTGNETVLYAFTGGTDGSLPESGLTRDGAGNLYGTTADGGLSGWGVVFKLDPAVRHYRVLHSFTDGPDGASPVAGLITGGPAGGLYGTTYLGGNTTSSSCPFGSSGCGVVFQLH